MANKKKNPIRNRLNAHAKEGLRRISKGEIELYNIYSNAKNELQRRIDEYVLTGDHSLVGPQLVQLIEELGGYFGEFEEKYRSTLKNHVSYVSQGFYHSALSDLADKGEYITGGINKTRLKLILDDDFAHVAGATRNMSEKTIASLRRLSGEIMAEANITGKTLKATTKKLYMAIKAENPDFIFVAKDGHKWNSDAYFEMLGKTLMHNNARESYMAACIDEGSDIVTVSVSPNPCDKCAKYENTLLSITGNTKGIPTVQDAIGDGVFHPRCMHNLTAVPPAVAKDFYTPTGKPLEGVNAAKPK